MLAVVVAVALGIGAQQPPPRPTAPLRDASATTTPTGTAVIRGRVLDGETKKPLRRARITANSPELGREPRTTSTNLDGRFELNDLPAGRYTISATRSGYLPLRYGQRRPLEAGKPLQIEDKQQIENVDFALPRMSVITGRVFDETTEPIESVRIFAMRAMWFQGKRRLVPAGSATTDDAGQYRVRNLAPGTYFIRANASDTWTVTESGVDQTYGYVPTYQPSTPDMAAARRITVGVGQEISNADVFLVPGRAVTVSGTAFDSRGRALAGQQVALGQETRGPEMGMFWGSSGTGGRVNPDGTFTIRTVVPGEYQIAVRTGGAQGNEAISMPVSVGSGDVENVALVPVAGWSVSGQVIADDGSPPTFAADRMRLAARLVDGDRDPRMGGSNFDSGRVKDDWTFVVSGVWAASHLRATVPDGWAVKAIQNRDGRDVTDEAIDLASGQELSGLRVVVTKNITAVSGQLADDKGLPIGDGTVLVFAEQADKWSEDSRFVRAARLDQQGKYEIKGLAPGAYLAVALDYVEDGIWNDPEFLESMRGYATKLTLTEGEARTVALKLTTVRSQ
ncbi:MAG TPA: carboxypeptidase-like regulatory domain-containing protein [Vicinamibacterales bacterium]|nr:carboxypeptidase-like regulatory domain-containing protein [Vicinamibacterales bacterium]